MKRTLLPLSLVLGVLLAACGVTGTETVSQSYDLGSQAYLDVAEDAEVTFEELEDGTTEVTIDFGGAIDSAFESHPAHIHAGDAGSGGAIVITLEPVDGTTGMSTTTVTKFDDTEEEDGTTTTGADVTYEDLLEYDGYVNVHLSADNLDVVFASANIGENEDVALPEVFSIVDLVTNSANAEAEIDQEFTILLEALSVAEVNNAAVAALTAQLADDTAGPFTVLAPTDDAFEAFVADSPDIENVGDLLISETLADVLSYHVLAGATVRSEVVAAATTGDSITTEQGSDLALSVDADGNILIDNKLAITVNEEVASRTNLAASNGVVHAIETILTPPAPATNQ